MKPCGGHPVVGPERLDLGVSMSERPSSLTLPPYTYPSFIIRIAAQSRPPTRPSNCPNRQSASWIWLDPAKTATNAAISTAMKEWKGS